MDDVVVASSFFALALALALNTFAVLVVCRAMVRKAELRITREVAAQAVEFERMTLSMFKTHQALHEQTAAYVKSMREAIGMGSNGRTT